MQFLSQYLEWSVAVMTETALSLQQLLRNKPLLGLGKHSGLSSSSQNQTCWVYLVSRLNFPFSGGRVDFQQSKRRVIDLGVENSFERLNKN